MDEYIAATGNSLGGMDEYWELIRAFPRLTGGAIWDYISPGIRTPRWILPDLSPAGNDGQIMGRPVFTEGKNGRGLTLSGHDDWVEFYRDPSLDITGKGLSIGFWVKPARIPQTNTFLAKGKYQYGIRMQDSDTLEFYIHSRDRQGYPKRTERISTKTQVGEDFYGNWHQLAGIYDGKSLKLYLDEQRVAETPFEGEMLSTPFALCLGRESETQDQGEYEGRMSSMTIDEIRIFDRAVSLSDLFADPAEQPVLALDFEEDRREGEFYAVGLGGRTYGVVWPDRRIQPELHQMKKSAQPVRFQLLDPESGRVKITNHHHFKNLNDLVGHWAIQVEGKHVQRGEFSVDLPAGASQEVVIPYNPPTEDGERILLLSFTLPSDLSWADAGHEVAWEQFELPSEPLPRPEKASGKEVRAEEGETEIRISGENFTYILDKTTGGLTSLRYAGTEYLEGGPEFQVWRAPLANDIDPWGAYRYYSELNTEGYGRSIDNQLRTMGLREMRIEVDEVCLVEAKGPEVIIRLKAWSLSSYPARVNMEWGTPFSGFERQETWTIHGNGTLELHQKITPFGQMPEMLPKMGLQFRLPKSFREVEWYGRGPIETYPDRKTGAKVGRYQSNADEMFEPYLFPQDYGNRTDVRWLRVHDGSGKGLTVRAENWLNFSLQKFTTDNLSRAVYTYQLKEASHTVLNLDFEVSGVGGTANRQLQPYRVKAKELDNRLLIKPF
jgi:beta-galactosidase